MTYGFESVPGSNKVTRPFNYYMRKIVRYIHNTMYYRRSEFNLNSADLSEEFNHCFMLLYYAKQVLKTLRKWNITQIVRTTITMFISRHKMDIKTLQLS